MPDFESLLREVCESSMSDTLGESGMRSVSWWLGRSQVTFSDCALRPNEFDDALVDLFQPMGALVIEARILTRVYRIQGARYQRGNSLSFADEVDKARRLFKENPKPEKPG